MTIGIAASLIAGIFVFGRTVPKKKAIIATEHGPNDGHDHGNEAMGEVEKSGWRSHWQLLLSLTILLIMLVLEFGFKYKPPFPVDLITYSIAYLLGGYNVL